MPTSYTTSWDLTISNHLRTLSAMFDMFIILGYVQ